MQYDSHDKTERVLAIGLDAPNHGLLMDWIARGWLPRLRELQHRSARHAIESEKRYSNEHCWIPVLTGRSRDRWDHWLDRWDPERYVFAEASLFDWIQAPLFYALGGQRHVAAFDLAAPVVPGVQGFQVSGFAVELNECFPQSDPPELMPALIARYGHDPKIHVPQRINNRLSKRDGISWTIPSLYDPVQMADFTDALVRSIERRTQACLDLLSSEPWDLFITAYSEVHSAGHVLWHLSQPHPLAVLRSGGDDPLLRVYQAVDRSIGELLAAMGVNTRVAFFTLDATVPDCLENARAAFLPEFLYRWSFPGKAALAVDAATGQVPALRLDYAAHWKHEVWQLCNATARDELESPSAQEAAGDPMSWCPANWYAPLWSRMPAFALPSVADGYIRVNVRGREANGLVGPDEFDACCAELARAVSTLMNARTGAPLVREVLRVRDDPFDADPKKPPADLIVVFDEACPVDTADSPLVGRIGPLPYFRSSSHQSHGATLENLLYVSGSGIEPGDRAGVARLEDVPATLLALLGVPLPGEFDGVPRW